MKKRSKYPPFPGSNWDYSVQMGAAARLLPPNKNICIYCHGQAVTEVGIVHQQDCPTREETK